MVQKLTIDSLTVWNSVRSLTPPNRAKMAKDPRGSYWLSLLTPAQYAELFPSYYKKQLPDIGRSVSGGVPMSGGGGGGSYSYGGGSSGGGSGSGRKSSSGGTTLASSKPDNRPAWQKQMDVEYDKIQAKNNPVGKVSVDNKGYVNKNEYYRKAVEKISSSPLNGFIPQDGKKYGIDGTPQSWAKYAMRLTSVESGFKVNTTNMADPGGSLGLLQWGEHYGITKDNWQDPEAQLDAFVTYSKTWVVDGGGYIQPPPNVQAKRYKGFGGFDAAFSTSRNNKVNSSEAWNLANTIAENSQGSTAPGTAGGLNLKEESFWPAGTTPTHEQRMEVFSNGGVIVNLDTNSGPKGKQTGPLIVIPDNATDEQRKAAEDYVNKIEAAYRAKFGTSINGTVKTTSENGRGRPGTIHTEPFAVTDTKAVDYFSKDPDGRALLAQITASTLGTIPGVKFSLPHDPTNNAGAKHPDLGAHGSGTNEVELAGTLLGDLRAAMENDPIAAERKDMPSSKEVGDPNQTNQIMPEPSLRPSSDPALHPGLQKYMNELPNTTEGQAQRRLLQQKIDTLGVSNVNRIFEQAGGNEVQSDGVNRVLQNQGVKADIRRGKLSDNLVDQLNYAAEQSNVKVEVFSGGQRMKDAPGATGSTRHDDGGAADFRLFREDENGKKTYLNMSNPEDKAVMEKFIVDSVKAGATGVGAGHGYMGSELMHVGGGTATYWGGADFIGPAWKQGMEAQKEFGAEGLAKWKEEQIQKQQEQQQKQEAVTYTPERTTAVPLSERGISFGHPLSKPKPATDGATGGTGESTGQIILEREGQQPLTVESNPSVSPAMPEPSLRPVAPLPSEDDSKPATPAPSTAPQSQNQSAPAPKPQASMQKSSNPNLAMDMTNHRAPPASHERAMKRATMGGQEHFNPSPSHDYA